VTNLTGCFQKPSGLVSFDTAGFLHPVSKTILVSYDVDSGIVKKPCL
jgi:hypothetical protein